MRPHARLGGGCRVLARRAASSLPCTRAAATHGASLLHPLPARTAAGITQVNDQQLLTAGGDGRLMVWDLRAAAAGPIKFAVPDGRCERAWRRIARCRQGQRWGCRPWQPANVTRPRRPRPRAGPWCAWRSARLQTRRR